MRRRKRSGQGESEKALQEAELHLIEVKQRGAEVNRISRDMRILRERNHFAERLQMLMGGHP